MRSPAFSCAAVAASRVTTHRLGGSLGGVASAPATMMTGGNRITVVVPARTTTGNTWTFPVAPNDDAERPTMVSHVKRGERAGALDGLRRVVECCRIRRRSEEDAHKTIHIAICERW